MEQSVQKVGAKSKARPAIPISSTQLWLEEAWDGWMKPAAVLLAILIVGGLYYADILGERVVGLAISLGLVALPLGIAAVHALPQVKSNRHASLLWGGVGLMGLFATVIILGAIFPGRMLYHGDLTRGRPDATLTGTVAGHELEVFVAGHLPNLGTASYDLAMVSPNETQHMTGEVKVQEESAKFGRRRMHGIRAEHGAHRFLADLTAAPTRIHLEKMESGLERLTIEVHEVWLPLTALLAMGAGILALLTWLDGRLSSRITQTYLSIAGTFALAFPYFFFQAATPHSLVKNAVGAAMMAGLGGVISGILLNALGRKLFAAPTSSPVRRQAARQAS